MIDVAAIVQSCQKLAIDEPIASADDELLSRIERFEEIRAAVDAAQLKTLAELDQRGTTLQRSQLGTGTWLARHGRTSVGGSKKRVRISRVLRHRLGEVLDALVAGTISFDHVRVLVDVCRPAIIDEIAAMQGELIELANGMVFEAWRLKIVEIADLLDQDGTFDPNDDLDRNQLSISATLDGITKLDGTLTGANAVVVVELVNAKADELFHRFKRDAEQSVDLVVPGRRTLMALALVELVRAGAAIDLHSSRSPNTEAELIVPASAPVPGPVPDPDPVRDRERPADGRAADHPSDGPSDDPTGSRSCAGDGGDGDARDGFDWLDDEPFRRAEAARRAAAEEAFDIAQDETPGWLPGPFDVRRPPTNAPTNAPTTSAPTTSVPGTRDRADRATGGLILPGREPPDRPRGPLWVPGREPPDPPPEEPLPGHRCCTDRPAPPCTGVHDRADAGAPIEPPDWFDAYNLGPRSVLARLLAQAPQVRTRHGAVLQDGTYRLLACDAFWVPVIVDNLGVPLDMGRAVRFATEAQRKAIALRDGGCVFPGCDQPPGWCDHHHLILWTTGGTTDLALLAALCRSHHGITHRKGWQMNATPDGWFWWRTPSGDILLSQRHGRTTGHPMA